jgi:hypothetical protein
MKLIWEYIKKIFDVIFCIVRGIVSSECKARTLLISILFSIISISVLISTEVLLSMTQMNYALERTIDSVGQTFYYEMDILNEIEKKIENKSLTADQLDFHMAYSDIIEYIYVVDPKNAKTILVSPNNKILMDRIFYPTKYEDAKFTIRNIPDPSDTDQPSNITEIIGRVSPHGSIIYGISDEYLRKHVYNESYYYGEIGIMIIWHPIKKDRLRSTILGSDYLHLKGDEINKFVLNESKTTFLGYSFFGTLRDLCIYKSKIVDFKSKPYLAEVEVKVFGVLFLTPYIPLAIILLIIMSILNYFFLTAMYNINSHLENKNNNFDIKKEIKDDTGTK